jgi:hypothetical protein
MGKAVKDSYAESMEDAEKRGSEENARQRN